MHTSYRPIIVAVALGGYISVKQMEVPIKKKEKISMLHN